MTNELRPRINNPSLWLPDRPPESIRQSVLSRNDYRCFFCGHRARKWMNIHHLELSNDLTNLKTVCVACHAVLHIGLNLKHEAIEIWKTEISQVEIVRQTRAGIAAGKTLADMKKVFGLKKGKYSPSSLKYADDLIKTIGDAPDAELEKPLCAIFVKFQRWQLDASQPIRVLKGPPLEL